MGVAIKERQQKKKVIAGYVPTLIVRKDVPRVRTV
jgi:hypothetical protein